jgi:hypothetical protein
VYTDDGRRKLVRIDANTTQRDVMLTVAKWYPCSVDGCYLAEYVDGVVTPLGAVDVSMLCVVRLNSHRRRHCRHHSSIASAAGRVHRMASTNATRQQRVDTHPILSRQSARRSVGATRVGRRSSPRSGGPGLWRALDALVARPGRSSRAQPRLAGTATSLTPAAATTNCTSARAYLQRRGANRRFDVWLSRRASLAAHSPRRL